MGSDNFYESTLVAEIYAQALEAHGFTVDRAGLNIGERPARLAAFESGQINLMPEYVGFGLEYYTQAPDASPEVAAVETSGDAATDAASLRDGPTAWWASTPASWASAPARTRTPRSCDPTPPSSSVSPR